MDLPEPLEPRIVRVDACAGPWPLHDAAASRRLERDALRAAPHGALMERAGLGVARLALALAPLGRHVHVWAGPGNNGGDGLVAARHLHRAGRRVSVTFTGNAARLPPEAANALVAAQQAGVAISADAPAAGADLHLDALLGLGAARAPEGAIAAAIAAMNAQRMPVLAVDLPSGLGADSGMPLGAAAVRASATLALLTLKPGCHTAQGRDCAGEVWLDRLGVAPAEPSAWLAGPPHHVARRHATHKGSYGDVAVVGGAHGMSGAAWLAARAALAAGAGRVYCSLLDLDAPLLDANRPELMGRRAWWDSAPDVLAGSTVACGCGGGDEVRIALPPLLARVPRLVLDADALNALAADAGLRRLLQGRAARRLATLLTPHPLEAARLLQSSAAEVQADRIAAATRLARDCGAAVLLKGSGSVVAADGAPTRIVPTGNAALASPGTGDVLAGWIAGLWAQSPARSAADIAADAAWAHGRAADLWLAEGHGAPLRAADLVERLALA